MKKIFHTIAQSTLETTSAAEAKKAVEDKKSSRTGWSKLIAKPNIFDYKSQEEEVKAFREWSWVIGKDLRSLTWAWQLMQRRPGASSYGLLAS